MIASSTALFALIASPLASVLADRVGRKRVLLYADLLFIVGSLIQASCSTVALMIIGRCVSGAGHGAASVVVPLYIAEVAPASHRGRLVIVSILLVTIGQTIGFMAAGAFAALAPNQAGWRWTIGFGALPAIMQAAIFVFMPDTPRWLVMVGRLAAARRVLQRLHGDGGDADPAHYTDDLLKDIQAEAREERETRQLRPYPGAGHWQWPGPWKELLSEGRYRRALTIACLLQALQQLCGFSSLMYFSATIFKLVGFKNPTLASLAIASTNFLFTIFALGLIDRVGRRRIILCSMPFMILGLLSAAFGFSLLPLSVTSELPEKSDHSGAAGLILASIIIYIASFALGLGNVPSMQSELYPLAVRSLGSGMATAVNWTGNFVMGLTFLPLMDVLSPSWTFVLYAGICAAGYYFIFRIYPETAGLSLEEAAALLEHGWVVQQ